MAFNVKKLKSDVVSKLKNKIHYQDVVLGDSYERKRMLCFFAHFSDSGDVDNYVVNLVGSIASAGCDVIFVSAAGKAVLESKNWEKLRELVRGVVVRDNYGYDFGSWKTGLDICRNWRFEYEHIVFANDSVYGPFSSLGKVFDRVESSRLDVWSLTDSYEREYHLQSYFWGLSHKALTDGFFCDFWDRGFVFVSDRNKVIKAYELAIYRKAVFQYGLLAGALFSIQDVYEDYCKSGGGGVLERINPTLDLSYELLSSWGYPFIKRELLQRNPKNYSRMDELMLLMHEKHCLAASLAQNHVGYS